MINFAEAQRLARASRYRSNPSPLELANDLALDGLARMAKSLRYIIDLAKAQAEMFGAPAKVKPQAFFVGPRGGRWADIEHTIPYGGEHGGLIGQTTILDPTAKDVTRKQHENPAVRAIVERQTKAFTTYMKTATAARESGDSDAEYKALAQVVSAAQSVRAAYLELGDRRGAKDWANYVHRAEQARTKAYSATPGAMLQSRRYVVFKPSELLRKAQARGGKYHRRVPRPGGGYHYIYESGQYEARKDAHLDGEGAGKAYLSDRIARFLAGAGAKGLVPDDLADLVKRHGAKGVAQVLRDGVKGGSLSHKKGRFYQGKAKS